MMNHHLADKVANALLYAIAFCIPFAKPLLPLLFVVFGGVQCWRYAIHRRFYRPACSLPIWTSVTTYLIFVAYTVFGFANDRANEILEIKFSYFAIPIMAFLINPITTGQLNRLYKMYILGCLAFDVIAVVHAAVIFHQTHDVAVLYYQSLSWYIHPSYQSMYHGFAIFLIARSVFDKPLFRGSNGISFLLIIIFSAMMGALASKAGIICLAIMGLFLLLYSAVKRRATKHVVALALCSVVAVLLINIISTGVASRITEAGKDLGALVNTGSEEVLHSTAYTSVTLRVVTWSSAFHVLMAHPFGVGIGRAAGHLDDYYISHQQPYAASLHLNAHQQFLQHGLDLGWLGIALLMITFVAVMQHLYKGKEYTGLVFCVLCLANFMLESMLETQAGIIFFFFWLMIYCRVERPYGPAESK